MTATGMNGLNTKGFAFSLAQLEVNAKDALTRDSRCVYLRGLDGRWQ